MSSLYIDRKGIEIKLSGETLVCYEGEQRVGTIPLAPVDRIYLKGDVTLQASLLAKLGEKKIGIICLAGRKNSPTLLLAQPHNDAARRLAQYELSSNEAFCLQFAKKLILLKLVTQKNWLWQAANRRLDKKCLLTPKAEELNSLIGKVNEQTNLPSLRGIEGRAGAVYFNALKDYLPPSLGFTGRNRRPPRDPFNAVLSLTYTLVHSEAVLLAYGVGLDPYIGFLHSLDFGRESLACDLIEPIRPLIDDWLLGCFRQEILRKEYFSETSEGCMLGKTGRIQFYREYEKAVVNWRKILNESCYSLANILKEASLSIFPQRRNSDMLNSNEDKNWKLLLDRYYFQQQNLLSDLIFHF